MLINQIHKRSLRTVYKDISSTFQQLLQRCRSVSIHHNNTQTLTTEVFKVVNNICPLVTKTFFDFEKTNTTSENFKKQGNKEYELPDMVSKKLFARLLNYVFLFLQI